MANPLKELQAHHYRALELKLLGRSAREIGEEIGMTEGSVRQLFIDPLFKTELEALQAEAIARTKETIIAAADKAAKKIIDLVDCNDDQVALRASKDILDRSGLKPTEKQEISANIKGSKLEDFM